MSTFSAHRARRAALAVAVGLAGCSGQQSGSGTFVPNAGFAQRIPMAIQPSWMAPAAKRKDLLYVSDQTTNDVYVYSYPQMKRQGTLTGFHAPFGECVDKHGNVFIVSDDASQILEYAHGGTAPIATLSDPGYFPRGCSIDPTTGNLAVANIISVKFGQGNIAIYKGAKGKPSSYYADANVYNVYSCGYDGAGNLFVDGENNGSSSFEFAELPHGAKKFTNIALNQKIGLAGAVQWDGKYVAVGNQFTDIYRFSIKGTKGTKVGTTVLKGVGRDSEFWIEGTNVIVPDSDGRDVGIWDYPAGGSAKLEVKGFKTPIGATVSLAQ